MAIGTKRRLLFSECFCLNGTALNQLIGGVILKYWTCFQRECAFLRDVFRCCKMCLVSFNLCRKIVDGFQSCDKTAMLLHKTVSSYDSCCA